MKKTDRSYSPCTCRFRWNQTLQLIIACFSLWILAASASAETINGFVTHIDSPSEIELGAMHVLIKPETICTVKVLLNRRRWSKATPLPQCTAQKMAIGVRILSVGRVSKGGKLIADRLEMREGYREPCPGCLLMFLSRSNPALNTWSLQGCALAEEAPIFTRRNQGWEGRWWVDGYPISEDVQTHMLTAPTFEIMQKRMRPLLLQNPQLTHIPGGEFHDLRSSDLLKPNTWAFYRAAYGVDSTPLASWMILSPNQTETGEEQFLSMYAHKIQPPDYKTSVAGSIQYSRGGPIRIVADRNAQEYLSRLGNMLVPDYQKDMPSTNPQKIDFHFYVVRPFVYVRKSYFVSIDGRVDFHFKRFVKYGEPFNAPVPGALVTNVISMPDGTILVPDVVLARMKNQAQIMALLSYAITSVLQKQAFHVWPINRPRFWDSPSDPDSPEPIQIGDEQLLRIGIRQMYLAGYDIREAPFAWALAAGKPATNPVIDSKQPDKEIPWYATYAFNYISQFYSDVDYSKLKRGEREYAQFLDELRKSDPDAFAVKK